MRYNLRLSAVTNFELASIVNLMSCISINNWQIDYALLHVLDVAHNLTSSGTFSSQILYLQISVVRIF